MSMHRPKLRDLALATVLGAAAAHPGALHAQDTEIYLGSEALAPTAQPNVLFVLDTSFSMTRVDFGETTSRIERLKTATDLILDSVNNVNVGIMRFTNPGGAVLFPVADIEGSAAGIDTAGQPDVMAFVRSAADDAEELGGVMCVNSPLLELTESPASCSETTIGPVSVTASTDDAEQSTGGVTTVALNSGTMEAVDEPGPGFGDRVNGLIFRSLGIPTGARITESFVEFESQSSREGPVTLSFFGERAPAPATFSVANGPNNRTRTAASVDWTPPLLTPNDFHRTPDLSAAVQEVVDMAGWTAASSLSVIFDGTTANADGERRDFSTADTAPAGTRSARLTVTYGTGPGGTQKVGLRFPAVNVPQGVRILRAFIEFTPAAQSGGVKRVTVFGEDADDADAFAPTASNISNRTKTTNSVLWDMEAWPTVGDPRRSPNLSSIVQEIVARPGWCGGQDMAFIIEHAAGTAARKAFSVEGDPTLAPVLRIDYDESTPLSTGQGCVLRDFQRQVSASLDDATEMIPSGDTLPTLNTSFMGTGLSSGFRFRELGLPQGAQVVSANLHVTGDIVFSGTASFDIKGQLTPDAASFSSSTNDITARPTTSAGVSWSPAPLFLSGQQYTSPDISAVVQEIVGQSSWVPGNSLVLIIQEGTGFRAVDSFEQDPARAPRLTLKAKIFLGDTGNPGVTVRQRLKDVVAELPAQGSTPLVDTFYEAALYMRGEGVDYGRTRGNASAVSERRTLRISHPGTYFGGTPRPGPSVCPPDDLNAVGCAFQNIQGSPVYKSPISESCQGNYVVLLTDGIANVNNSEQKIRTLTGDSSCASTLLDGSTPLNDAGERCGIELAEFLATQDQSDDVDEVNVVNTFTIGFNLQVDTDNDGVPDAPSPAVAWLEDVADAGGGDFFPANSAQELVAVFRDILAEILSRTTSFATPSLSVNAFNRLFHRNEVYFSLFVPSNLARWDGNIKKYQICRSELDGCEVGEVLDYREPPPGDVSRGGRRAGLPAIDGATQRILSSARSDWLPGGDAPDGAEVLVGGAGRVLRDEVGHASRRVFTFAGGSLPTDLSTGSLHDVVASNAAIDIALLGGSTTTTDPNFMTATERGELIDWIRGRDVDDEDNDNDTTDTRYLLADPLHSSPFAVTFGGTEAEPVIKVFVGTNDGSVRMLNAHTGKEEWAFIPPALLRNQRVLRDNPRQDHVYGVDGTPTLWINDEDNDGVINPAVDVNGDGQGEFVRMFIGLRRGGAQVIAFDVTPATLLTDPVNDTIVPELLWIIQGNNAGTTLTPMEYARLGQTWSRPRLTTIRSGEGSPGAFTSQSRPALIFAGGYDAGAQDGSTGLAAAGVGNAIYIVDPSDGSRIAYVTAPANLAQHTGAAGIGVPGMVYPIPSDVALLDTDGDGASDRLYVPDTGGQVWRMDMAADTTDGGVKLTVGRLAVLSTLGSEKNSRKFFYPPDVVQVRGRTALSVVGDYDLVTLTSGNRAHPLDLDVQNRFFAIHDETIGTMTDGATPAAADGLADDYPVARDGSGGTASTGTPIAGAVDADGAVTAAAGDLLRVNDRLVFDPTTSEGAANLAELKARSGYYLDLGPPAQPGVDPPFNAGEKGLSSPIILGGKVFFTTYLPRRVLPSGGCALSEGGGLLYGLDVLTGAPAYNYDQSPDTDPLSVADRTYELGGGIPSAAVPIFQPEAITLLIGGGGGATTVNPNITLPRDRTYWVQE